MTDWKEARSLLDEGRAREAESLVREALARGLKDANADLFLGDLLVSEGRVAEALPCFERALQRHKDPQRVLRRLFVAHLQAGEWSEAFARWLELSAVERRRLERHLRELVDDLAELQTASTRAGTARVQDAVARVAFLLILGDTARAEQVLITEVTSEDRDYEAWRAAIDVSGGTENPSLRAREKLPARDRRRIQGALDLLRNIRNEDEDWMEAALSWLNRQKRWRHPATESLAWNLRERLVAAVLDGLKTIVRHRGPDVALPRYDRMQAILPEDGNLLLSHGDCLMRVDKANAALAMYRRALSCHKFPERVRLRMFGAALQTGDRQTAEAVRSELTDAESLFQASLVACDYVDALRRGRALLDDAAPAVEWLLPLLYLLFELNLFGLAREALDRADAEGVQHEIFEQYRFWCDFETIADPHERSQRMDQYQHSQDDRMAWCARAAATLHHEAEDPAGLQALRDAVPVDSATPLAGIVRELVESIDAELIRSGMRNPARDEVLALLPRLVGAKGPAPVCRILEGSA